MNRIIYFDMDGVLADYDGGVATDEASTMAQEKHDKMLQVLPIRYRKMSPTAFAKALATADSDPALAAYKEARSEMNHAKSSATMNPGFFAGLSLMPGARRMVNEAVKLFGRVSILSAPVDPKSMPEVRQQCVDEKNEWLDKNFPGVFSERIFDKHKQNYASPAAVLVDDNRKNTIPFEKAGGTSILFISSPDTIRQLKSIARGELTTESTLRRYIRSFITETT
jgi:5'(3')-deoxyribonucleotidase